MKMKGKLIGLALIISAACAFALTPVVASACHCKKGHCHKSTHSKKKSTKNSSQKTSENNPATPTTTQK